MHKHVTFTRINLTKYQKVFSVSTIEIMILNLVLLIGALQGYNIRTEFNIDGLGQSFYEFECVYAPSGCSQVCPKDYSLDPCFSDSCNFFGSVAGLGFCDDQIFKVTFIASDMNP